MMGAHYKKHHPNENIPDLPFTCKLITSIAGLRCEFGGHLPISSKKSPRPIQVVLGGSYAF